jgi:hypothetical protein
VGLTKLLLSFGNAVLDATLNVANLFVIVISRVLVDALDITAVDTEELVPCVAAL